MVHTLQEQNFMTLLSHSNLTQPAIFELDGRWMARWSDCYKRILSQARKQLQGELKGKLSKRCTHVKSHGGVKKSIRLLVLAIPEFSYAARFSEALRELALEQGIQVNVL
jgi:hypothetical protein